MTTKHPNRDLFGKYGFSLAVVDKVAFGALKGERELALEARQRAVIKLLQIPKGRRIRNPKTYAKTVTRNVIRDLLREKSRTRTEVAVDHIESYAAAYTEALERSYREELTQWREQLRAYFRRFLAAFADQLDEVDRSILELISKGQTKAQIARSLRIDRGTVYYRIGKIEKLFKDFDPPPHPPSPPSGGGNRASPPRARGDPPIRGDPHSRSLLRSEYLQTKEANKCREHRRYPFSTSLNPTRKDITEVGVPKRRQQSNAATELGLDQRFKELFLQLPAFREEDEDGPSSLEEIEEALVVEYFDLE